MMMTDHAALIARLRANGGPLATEAANAIEALSKRTTRTRRADTFDADWDLWYAAYPRKVAKAAARAAWDATKGERPELPAMLTALIWQRRQEQWTRERGIFCPHPATYLRAHQWADEPPQETRAAPVLRSVSALCGFHQEGGRGVPPFERRSDPKTGQCSACFSAWQKGATG